PRGRGGPGPGAPPRCSPARSRPAGGSRPVSFASPSPCPFGRGGRQSRSGQTGLNSVRSDLPDTGRPSGARGPDPSGPGSTGPSPSALLGGLAGAALLAAGHELGGGGVALRQGIAMPSAGRPPSAT